MASSPNPIDGENSPLLLSGVISENGSIDSSVPATVPPLSSTAKTFANLMLCTLGTGVLSLPYTFSTVGWASGLLIVIISGAIAYHGMMLLIRSKHLFLRLHPDALVAGYGDLMFHVFGGYGRLAVDLLLILSSTAICISYFTFIGQNIASIVSTLIDSQVVATAATTSTSPLFEGMISHHQNRMTDDPMLVETISSGLLSTWIWTSSVLYTWIIFPLEVALAAIPSLTYLAPLSSLGVVANLSALATVVATDIVEIRKASLGFLTIVAFRNMVSVPSAFGVGIYAFRSAGIMIPIELSMAQPWKLGAVLAWAFVLVGLVYGGFGMLGYMAFGDDTQQTITLNLQEGIVPIIVKVALCSCLMIALPLELNPMWELIERRFSQRKVSLLLRALIVFLICLFSTTVTQLAVFLSLAGSSISCLLGFILPASLHLMIMKRSLEKSPSLLSMAADYVLIAFGLLFGAAFGLLFGAFGTTVSFINLL